MKRHYLRKSNRLAGNSAFKAVLSRKLFVSNDLLKIYLARNTCGRPRLGLSVSKSLGTSVQRNRLKRLLREVFRQNQDRIPADYDYVVMFSKKKCQDSGPDTLSLGQLREAFLRLVEDAEKRIKKQ